MPVLPHGFQGRAPLRTAPAASYPINAHTLRKNYRSQHRCTAQAAQQALKPVAQQAPAKKRKGHYKRRRKSKSALRGRTHAYAPGQLASHVAAHPHGLRRRSRTRPKHCYGTGASGSRTHRQGALCAEADKLRPPTCLPQIGVCFSPDQEWRQGLANIQDGTRSPVLGTNADVLDALERRSQQVDAGGVDDESGDEASCSGGVVDSSDCESDAKHQPALPGVRETLPEPTANATWLHAATREELIEYALWLEGEVCRLRTVRSLPCPPA